MLGAPEPLGGEGRAIVGDTGVVAGFIGVAPQDAIDDMRVTLDDIAEGVGFEEIAAPK